MANSEQRLECPCCYKSFKPAGLRNYKKACKKKHDDDVLESQFLASILTQPQSVFGYILHIKNRGSCGHCQFRLSLSSKIHCIMEKGYICWPVASK